MPKANESIPSSFRDPSGFLFCRDNLIYRQINTICKEDYGQLMNSGLYQALVEEQLLIPHQEVDIKAAEDDKAYKVIKPEPILFISYPYEWCFSQLKDAALTVLKIQRKALEFGISLKDASVYNIQFRMGKPIFIDTLSFERYTKDKPWAAYRQFCQHFLAPLTLMSYGDVRLNQLFRTYIDGIPLDLANALIPFRARLQPALFSHIQLHAKTQNYFADKAVKTKDRKMSLLSLRGIIDNLESAIKNLRWRVKDTQWTAYYRKSNYSQQALEHKKEIIAAFLDKIKPKIVWDLGANVGRFSRLASNKGIPVVSFDIDPACVEQNYLACVKNGETNILPLLVDLTNPSPGIGWENKERMSLSERGPAEAVFALALVHHLAVSNNLPFNKIAEFFNKTCRFLIIEFIPKDDLQVQGLLLNREDIFSYYRQDIFECEFRKYFIIEDSVKIRDSKRVLYLMKKS